MTLLSVTNLEASYGRVKVLHGLDLEIAPGAVVVVLGANGVGKTTTLRAISGVTKNQGSIVFDGTDVTAMPIHKIMARGVRHVPEGRGTLKQLTVDENLRLGAYLRRDDGIEADIATCLELFPRLSKWRGKKAGALSGGEQQMLAISRAIMGRPKLLLLDEPSLGLAPKLVAEVFEALGRLNQEYDMTMLVVEQNADIAVQIAHHVYVLETGRVIFDGTPEAVSGNASLRESYLGY